MLAGNANAHRRRRRAPLEPTAPVGHGTFAQPMQLARIHQYLSMATPLLWMRQPDTIGVLGLALNACAERNGYPEDVDRIRELLEARARPLASRARARGRGRPPRRAARLTFRLIHLADIEAVTAGCLS